MALVARLQTISKKVRFFVYISNESLQSLSCFSGTFTSTILLFSIFQVHYSTSRAIIPLEWRIHRILSTIWRLDHYSRKNP